jgi:hypothetical protein
VTLAARHADGGLGDPEQTCLANAGKNHQCLLAHSITLAAAALGWAEAPQTPVEAVVALSIVFAAAEVARQRIGLEMKSRSPWIMAFAFGLLHGLGFGGAPKEVGLPQSDVPLALLTLNLGIEAGQLLFVVALLALSPHPAADEELDELRDLGSAAASPVVAGLAGPAAMTRTVFERIPLSLTSQ